jgi:hypothetical protein
MSPLPGPVWRRDRGGRRAAAPRGSGPQPRPVPGPALRPGGSREALGDPVAVGVGGPLGPQLGPVRRAVGVRAGRPPRRPLPGASPPAPVTGRPQGGGLDGGLRAQAPAAPHGHLVGVELVGCRLAALERWHRERVPEDQREPCWSPPVREPVPGEETVAGHDQRFPRGRDGLEKRLRTGLQVPVQQERAILVQDTDGHAAGVEIATAVKWVLGGGESHEVFSFVARGFSPYQHTTGVG